MRDGKWLERGEMSPAHIINALKLFNRSPKRTKWLFEEIKLRKDEIIDYIGTELLPERSDPYFIRLMVILDLERLKYYFNDSDEERLKMLMENKCKKESS